MTMYFMKRGTIVEEVSVILPLELIFKIKKHLRFCNCKVEVEEVIRVLKLAKEHGKANIELLLQKSHNELIDYLQSDV